MTDTSPYAPPATEDLVAPEKVPPAVLDAGLRPGGIELLGALVLVGLVIVVLQGVYVFIDEFRGVSQGAVGPVVVDVLGTALYVFVLFRWRRLLNLWVGAHKANKYIYALMILSVLMTAGTSAEQLVDGAGVVNLEIINLALLSLIGLAMLLYGVVLVRQRTDLALFRTYAILMIIGGAMVASIVLLVLSVPVIIATEIVFAILLFGMGGRLRRARRAAAQVSGSKSSEAELMQ